MLSSPSLLVLHETTTYWSVLRETLRASKVAGPMVHDARIAVLCQVHGVRQLWSADRDFSRFAGVSVLNPVVVDDGNESA